MEPGPAGAPAQAITALAEKSPRGAPDRPRRRPSKEDNAGSG
jgi:hypothetical protein